jgi:O-antigen biosynthesis protein
MKLSVIILNWNGQNLLEECLPSVVEALKIYQDDSEIIVVDNGSSDGSVEFVKTKFINVSVLALDKNYGFGEGNNAGVEKARGDIIILLNNDMLVDKNFIKPLIDGFEEDTFAIGCQIYFQDKDKKREETGKTFAYWDQGTIRYLHQDVTELDYSRKYIPVFWGSGGAVAYDRKKILELGGFRKIYSPAYAEDTDISYRAWKRGWKVYFAPESIVFHKHRASSTKRFSKNDIEILTRRNHLFFIWSNVSSKRMLTEHMLGCLFRLIKTVFTKERKVEWFSFMQALPKLLIARQLSRGERKYEKYSDESLIKNFFWKKSFLTQRTKLSILIVSPYVPCLDVHATGTRIYNIAKQLSTKHDVTILTFIDKQEEIQHVEKLKTFCKNVIHLLRTQSLTEPDYFHIIPNMVTKEFCQQKMKQLLLSEVLSGKYDVAQFEFLQMAYVGRMFTRMGCPALWVDHEVQHAALWRQYRHQCFFSWQKIELFFRWMVMLSFELSVAKRFIRTIFVTEEDKFEVNQYLPRLLASVIPLGVDLKYYSATDSDGEVENTLVFTGYFLHSPNADAMEYFVKSIFPKIKKQIPFVKLYIVGSSPTPEIKSLNNNIDIFVTGWVPDLRKYLQKAAVYIAPIRLGVGFRGKLLEAFAASKPVVATSLAARGMPVERGKSIMIADTDELFAEHVVSLLKNKSLRISIGAEARKIVENTFSWEKITHINEKIIRDAVETK